MDITTRYLAKESLRATIEEQGRKASWLSAKVGISRPLMSLVMGRERTLGHEEAAAIATMLQVPFSMLFELADASETVSHQEAIA